MKSLESTYFWLKKEDFILHTRRRYRNFEVYIKQFAIF